MTFDVCSNRQNEILNSAESTTLVLIDYQLAFFQCFDEESIALVMSGLTQLLGAIERKKIPVVASFVETNRIDPKLCGSLENIILPSTRVFRSCVNPWDDPDFPQAIDNANRPRLLIAGLSVETSLSFTALCALEQGYDVYVVKDACLGFSEQSIISTFERLTQAGVVIVTWRQVLFEWSQGNVEIGLLRRMLRPG